MVQFVTHDRLVADEIQAVAIPPVEPDDQLPTLTEVVAQIKATLPNPNQIQRQLCFRDTFAIATPTLTEMLYGIQMLLRARRNVADWQQLSVMFDCQYSWAC